MDPFTIALATFGVQKLRGKSTKRALRDAALLGGGAYALGHAGTAGGALEDQLYVRYRLDTGQHSVDYKDY